MISKSYWKALAVRAALLGGLSIGTAYAASKSDELKVLVLEVKTSVEELSPLLVETDADAGFITLIEPGDWTIEERKSRRAEMRITVKDLDPRKIHYEPHQLPYIVNGRKTVGAIYIACTPDKKCMRLSYVDAGNGEHFKISDEPERATIDILDGVEVDKMRHFALILQRWIALEQGS